MPEWKNGLCSCFGNIPVCALSYFVPCYVFGKTAEKNGEDCVKCGLVTFVPLANLYFMTKQRQAIREKQGIEGSCVNDLCVTCFCGLCALTQQAREVEADLPGIPEMSRQ